MKKNILIGLISMAFASFSCAQTNPIKNLIWSHWYDYPNNFFNLTWNAPDVSINDTLIGYKVYRNNVLYRFQTETSLHHFMNSDNNTGEDFVYNFTPPFYIHVKAVYNYNHIESSYTDSVLVQGAMIGLQEFKTSNINVYPNPTADYLSIFGNFEIKKLSIVDFLGREFSKEITVINEDNDIKLDVRNIPNGIYFLIINGRNFKIEKQK